MEREQELISVIIPVYNIKEYLERCVDSVLAQTWGRLEILLVDDGSTDGTEKLVDELRKKDSRIRVFHKPNGGSSSARNLGISLARGRYIAYLDADDRWREDKLELELAFLKDKQAGFVFSGYEFGNEEARGTGKVVHVPGELSYGQALANTTIFSSTVMMDTEKIGKSLMEMPYIKSEDTACWWKILRSGVTAYGLDENLVIYRRAGKTLSSNKLEAIRRIWNLYRQAEGLSVPESIRCFVFWAFRAVRRRV